jgi:hypothetical protein
MLQEIKFLSMATALGIALFSSYNSPIVQGSIAELFATPDSPGSVAIGTAEGTRTADGAKTVAYDGHRDPGNGRLNKGTFSEQHGAATPEEADRRQLFVLRHQVGQIQSEAQKKGISLGQTEIVNGADLANQSPLAAGDYVDRLKQCQAAGKAGSDAVLCARVESYRDPRSGRFDAPGLGGAAAIESDQKRRMNAIEDAIGQ